MKSYRFGLSSFTRKKISKRLSVIVAGLFFLPTITFATPRRTVSVKPVSAQPTKTINAATVEPVVIEVTTTNDGDNLDPSVGCDTEPGIPGEQCSLRAAIQRAHTFPGNAEIRFNIPSTEFNCNSGLCIINLTRTLPTLQVNMQIVGPGANNLWVRRTTGGDYRIFMVTAAAVALSGMSINGGRPAGVSSGGALVNAGNGIVNLSDCVLGNNSAGANGGFGGALSNEGPGTINVTNCFLEANKATQFGGAIYNGSSGTVNVTGSVLYQNTVTEPTVAGFNGGGAGIANATNGTVNVTGSLILNNTVNVPGLVGVSGGGAGISNFSDGTVNVTNSVLSDNIVTGGDGPTSILRGGGIRNDGIGTVTVTNSVLFRNKAVNGGGIANVSGTLKVSNSTITENTAFGGGLYGKGTVKSSIIARNILGASSQIDISGTFTSEGFNLIGAEEGGTGFNLPTDLKGTTAARLDPKFDPNGVTITVRTVPHQVPGIPLCGSPVIDKGVGSGLTTDVRGLNFPRTIDDPNQANAGDGTDIGAFEREACAQTTFVVNTTADGDDANPGDGTCDTDASAAGSQCSLRAALKESNSIAGDYVVNFAIPSNDPGFDPSAGRHTINLTGALPEVKQGNLTINGPGANKLTVRRNTGGFYRLLQFADVIETVSISGITFSNGFQTADGGALLFSGKTLNISGCVFTGNTTGGSGGAIFAFASNRVNVVDSTFSGNFSGVMLIRAGGGAIHVRGALSVTGSTFTDNLTSSYGGGINLEYTGGSVESSVTNSVFSGNGADAGAGLYVSAFGPVMRVTNSKFLLNIATIGGAKGGGIFHNTGSLIVTDSTLTNNEGCGIEIGEFSSITTTIVGSTISGNTFGGVATEFASVPTGKTLNIINSTITGNINGPGVGIFRAALNVSNSTITHNESGGIRRNISDNNGTWTVKSSIVAANASGFGDVLGTFTSQGFNLIGNGDLGTGFTNGVNNDQVGTAGAPLDPKLDPAGLQDRGGPTHTIALLADSPAIDKGTSAGLNGTLGTDQRGAARVFDDPAAPNAPGGDSTDIGAFELQPGGPTPTPTPTPTPSPSPSPSPTPTPSPSPNPSPSPSPSPSPQNPNLTVTSTSLVRTNCGDIAVGVTVQNVGGATANNVRLTVATLVSPTTNGAPLPQDLGNLAPGRSATVIVTFSGANNPRGSKRTLRVDGTYTGGTFTDKWKVSLP